MRINTLLLFLTTLLFSSNGHSTTILYKTFAEITEQSDYLVYGTIQSTKAKKSHTGFIYTVLTIKDAYQITPEGLVDINHPVKLTYEGGVIFTYGDDGKPVQTEGQLVLGTPVFNDGDQVIVAIKDNGKTGMPVFGWAQGIFIVDGQDVYDYIGNELVGFTQDSLVKRRGNDVFVANKLLQGANKKHYGKAKKIKKLEFISVVSERLKNKRKFKTDTLDLFEEAQLSIEPRVVSEVVDNINLVRPEPVTDNQQ